MIRTATYLTLFLAALFANSAIAQSHSDRAGSWDFGILVLDQSSENLVGEQGATLDISGEVGWGLTAGYNINDRLAVMFDFAWASPDYEATRILEGSLLEDTIRAELDIYTYQLKGVYHFIDGPFTPFAELAAGWTTMDSNIIDGAPTSGCWYDPWWGYICDTFYSTYSKSRFSYGAAVGLRFDMSNGMGIKGSYGVQEIDTSNATESASFDAWRVDLLWRF